MNQEIFGNKNYRKLETIGELQVRNSVYRTEDWSNEHWYKKARLVLVLHGKNRSYAILGTYPVSETRGISITYIKLSFARGEEVLRFERRRNDDPFLRLGTPYPQTSVAENRIK